MRKIAAAMTIALLLAAGCGEVNTPQLATSETKAPSEAKTQVFHIGDRVVIGDLAITVNGTRKPKPTDFLKPKEGNIWIAVDATIENLGSQPTTISSLAMFKLADADGYNYGVTIGPDSKAQLDGELGAGRKMRGEVVFEIPKDATGLQLIFTPSIIDRGQVVVDLSQQSQ